jgi:Methylene-tetrahydrofolate reductase C terminal
VYRVRRWSVRHAGFFERLYEIFEDALVRLDPLFSSIGYARLERPVAVVERVVKGFLFDCRMCGQCVLSSTGMSCPMNCPKGLRNGPCGGVRPDGSCEVLPDMRCVWVESWEGSRRMRGGDAIQNVQVSIDNRLWGHSSWLRRVREHVRRRTGSQDLAT